jgi:hypothetical protein
MTSLSTDQVLNISKEIINGIGDCLGLWGAILLARPFVDSQNLRNIVVRLQRHLSLPQEQNTRIVDGSNEFEEAAAISVSDLHGEIDISSDREYRRGILGAWLLAAAFTIKLLTPLGYALYEFLISRLLKKSVAFGDEA